MLSNDWLREDNGDQARVLGQGYSQRSTYLYDRISMAFGNDSNKDTLEFVHDGKYVCGMAWYSIHGVSKTTFYRYNRRFFEGGKCASHGNTAIIYKGYMK